MAKQLYIDENGNPIEVSGTINTAELLPISGNDTTDTKSYIDTGLSGFNWLGAGDFTLSNSTTSFTLTQDMTNIKEIYFGLYLNVGSIGKRIRKSLTIPVYELKNVGVFFDEMITTNDRLYFEADYTDSTHLAVSSVSIPTGYTFGVKIYVR
ncbi:MAG: hypothetical protein J6S14_14730 [Clostridia bacterium]|nr:hypothetical protein [Clostridia bacterium]